MIDVQTNLQPNPSQSTTVYTMQVLLHTLSSSLYPDIEPPSHNLVWPRRLHGTRSMSALRMPRYLPFRCIRGHARQTVARPLCTKQRKGCNGEERG